MISIKFKRCCNDCPHIDPDMETRTTSSIDTMYVKKLVRISCKHMAVCEAYNKQYDKPEEEKEIEL